MSWRNLTLCALVVSAIAGIFWAFLADAPRPTGRGSVGRSRPVPALGGVPSSGAKRELVSQDPGEIATGSGVCRVEFSALFRYSRRPVGGCTFELQDVESLERVTCVGNSLGSASVDVKPGLYGVQAACEGLVVANNPCPQGFIDVSVRKRVEYVFQEPHVCAFRLEGPTPYRIQFTDAESSGLLYHKSKQAARIEAELAAQHDAIVQVYLLDDPACADPARIVNLFYEQGVLVRRLKLVPLGMFSAPETIALTSSALQSPASATVAFSCINPLGEVVDLGPIGLRRVAPLHGFMKAEVVANADVQIPEGTYRIRLNHSIAPWVIQDALAALGIKPTVKLTAGQRLEIPVRLAEGMLPVTVLCTALNGRKGSLVFARKVNGKPIRGRGTTVEHGQVIQVPPSTEAALLYSGANLIGTVMCAKWMITRELRFEREGN